jgi:hypothetical protein
MGDRGVARVRDLGRALALLGLSALITACAHARPTPVALPFPPWPTLRFERLGPNVCLSQEDAGALDKWAAELKAFEGAWRRLQQ